MTLLLNLAIGLIIAGGIALFYHLRTKKQSAPAAYQVPAVAPRTPEEELSSLGILEIRPKGTAATVPEDTEEGEVHYIDDDEIEKEVLESDEVEVVSVQDAESREEVQVEAETSELEERIGSVDTSTESLAAGSKRGGVSRREALFRLMNAVQASADGYTACLVRSENGSLKIEAFVSQNPSAVGSEAFDLGSLFSDEKISESAVTVVEIGTEEFPVEMLRYYEKPVAVRQLAIAPVKGSEVEDSYFLLVDALAWQDLDDPWQRLMIGQFATLIGTFLATPVSEEDGGEFLRPRIRSRREIIEEEMEKARSDETPLALALVYLNRAEEIAGEGEKALVNAEKIMEDRLEDAILGGRLERFGELTYGIFHPDEAKDVEAWALQLQEELLNEGSTFEGGVSIGIALLQNRHENADHFRADATEALREAFETGACTIIE